MQVTVNVPDWLAAEAREHGLSVEAYIEEMLTRRSSGIPDEGRLRSIGAAIDRFRELRKGNALAGISIKDLIHEGHRY